MPSVWLLTLFFVSFSIAMWQVTGSVCCRATQHSVLNGWPDCYARRLTTRSPCSAATVIKAYTLPITSVFVVLTPSPCVCACLSVRRCQDRGVWPACAVARCAQLHDRYYRPRVTRHAVAVTALRDRCHREGAFDTAVCTHRRGKGVRSCLLSFHSLLSYSSTCTVRLVAVRLQMLTWHRIA